MVTHIWVQRAYCLVCKDYLWTNPGSPCIVCACGASEIQENVVLRGEAVSDEAAFANAVATDLGVPLADLDLRQG